MIRAVIFLAAFMAVAGCASTGLKYASPDGVPQSISSTFDPDD